jgi:hypothetical protein
MDLHGNRQSVEINDRGAAFFPGIPGDLYDQEVSVSVDAAGFENVDPTPKKLHGDELYLEVRKKPGRLHGIVTDNKNRPIASATIDVEGVASATTLSDGRFKLEIPAENVRPNMDMRVSAPGYVSQSHTVTAGGDEIEIALEKEHR